MDVTERFSEFADILGTISCEAAHAAVGVHQSGFVDLADNRTTDEQDDAADPKLAVH